MSNLSIMLKQAQQWRDQGIRQDAQHISFNNDHVRLISPTQDRVYVPSPTGDRFANSESFIKLVFGPYGSGKSTMCVQQMVRLACRMPYWSNGRRRARGLVIRNTSGELTSTTLQTWLQWMGDLGDISKRQKPLMTYEHVFNDGNGLVELELVFLALDRPDDVRKLKSMEATFAYLNELSELPQNVLSHIKGRVNGRYPSKSFCSEPYWSGILADTNPCATDHWIYKDFEEKRLENYEIFYQPPGLLADSDGNWIRNADCDNASNLSDDYYLKLAEGQSTDFVKVFCLGQYGSVGTGKNVYPEYNSDWHAVEDIPAIQGDPLILGWDFGLTPACIVAQVNSRGQVLVLKEYCATDMGIRTFAESVVIPSLVRDFPYCKVGSSVGDPAGAARDSIMEELSCLGELNALGLETIAARTNDLEPRIGAVRFFLNKAIDGKPGMMVSKKGCPVLHRGFVKDYVFKRLAVSGEERYKDKPDKNATSHPHDALQYLCGEIAADSILAKQGKKPMQEMFNPVFRWQ